MAKIAGTFFVCCLCLLLTGCPQRPEQQVFIAPLLHAVEFNDPTQLEISDNPIALNGAANEVLDFVVEVEPAAMVPGRTLRIRTTAAVRVSAYKILSVPADLNRASFIRETGRSGRSRKIPRVLLPLKMQDDEIELSSLGDSSGQPILIWVELNIPSDASPGEYLINCELMEKGVAAPAVVMPVKLTINNFSLPAERHLQLVGRLDWTTLQRLYPAEFAGVMPRLLNRRDPRNAGALQILDRFVHLAQENGATVVVPTLQPTVKWLPGAGPKIDWTDFDSVVGKWLNGKNPLAYWPLPSPDFLDSFDLASQAQYWKLVADHFEKNSWLTRAPVVLANESSGPANDAQSILLCTQANLALAAHPKLRVQIPLEDNQINSRFTDAMKSRLFTLSTAEIPSPHTHWMKPQEDSLNSQSDIRALGWQAFLDDVSMIFVGDSLVSTAALNQPVNPAEMIWFYPGQEFGADQPLPTIQLKWLRRAQQDFEYLQLARQHGHAESASQMARVLTRPMQLSPNQKDDITLNLFRGNVDARIWSQALQRLARPVADELRTLPWLETQERSTVLARSIKWFWDTDSQNPPGNWMMASFGLDIYNTSQEAPTNNQIQWTALSGGWLAHPEPSDVPPLPTYHVSRLNTLAKFNLDQISSASREPLELTFIDGFTGALIPCRFILPVAASERREKPLVINGSLDEWASSDAIQLNQPLVRMLDRPSLHPQQMQSADLPSSIFTGWSDDNLYIAFRLGGVSSIDLQSVHNFVDYQSRRAWGEDLCEILIRPIYVDNTLGLTMHIVCKPSGPWVERKLDDHWQPFEAAGVRYASSVDPAAQIWRGEIAIPWNAIVSNNHGRPSLLRFNFSQHQNATGQDASWAGPIDFGRDDSMMGLIHLREPNANAHR
jgi:hypothetical protein